jgi:DNA ligase-1
LGRVIVMLVKFARMCEAIERQTPTESMNVLNNSWKSFKDKSILTKILALDLVPNNLRKKKLLKWVTSSYGVFEDEVKQFLEIYDDFGTAIYHFDGNSMDSNISLKEFLTILELDGSQGRGEQYEKFNEAFTVMSSLEKKWCLRYMLRKPRNGFSEGGGNLTKYVSKYYGRDAGKDSRYHSLTEIVASYEGGFALETGPKLGVFISPMLAKAIPREKWPKENLVEYKYDGARYQIHKRGYDVVIFNRKGKVVTEKFPDIIEIINEWENDFIIDTEIYPVTNEGRPAPFKKMGTRIHSKDIQKAVENCPIEIVVFDCMKYGGVNLIDTPLRNRLEYIEKFPNQAVRENADSNWKGVYSFAISGGFEGIMVKDLNACYESGKRSVSWAKYKPPRIDFDVVITGARYGEGKRSNVFGSYDISVRDEGGFIQIGSIGTGFSDADLELLTDKCRKFIDSYDKDTFSILPRVVIEVTADLVTKNEKGDYGLRFPRMVRIRDDKPVNEINTIEEVKNNE